MANFTIFCVDPRVPAVSADIIRQLGDKSYTTTAIGASLGIDGEIEKIATMVEKLHVDRVNIIDHLSCKAYELSFGEMSQEEEQTHHEEELKKAAEKVRAKFPNLEVRTYLLNEVTPEAIAPKMLEIS